jgi:HEAT repeat protein
VRDAKKSITEAVLGDDPQALADLLERIPYEEWRARRRAVGDLARMGLAGRDMRPANRRSEPRDDARKLTRADAQRILAEIAADAREHEGVRWRAANALGDHGDETVIPVLAEVLRDPSRHLRKGAARSMTELGLAGAEPHLLDGLNDPEKEVRAAAACALGVVGTPRAVEPLAARAASDEKLFVRQEALAALRAIGTIDARRAADEILASASGLTRWRLRRWMEREGAANWKKREGAAAKAARKV